MFNNTTLSQNPIVIAEEGAGPDIRGRLVGRNVVISGHRTSIRLEPEMWEGLREIAQRERSSLHQVCTSVSLQKPDDSSLTASIRVFIMRYFRNATTEEGHGKAGHGFGLTLGMGMSMNKPPPHYSNHPTAILTKTSFA